MRVSNDYRVYPDRWRTDPGVMDEPADVRESWRAVEEIVDEIGSMLAVGRITGEDMEAAMLEQMAQAVFVSKKIERLGLGLDETMKMCMEVFYGGNDLEYTER